MISFYIAPLFLSESLSLVYFCIPAHLNQHGTQWAFFALNTGNKLREQKRKERFLVTIVP